MRYSTWGLAGSTYSDVADRDDRDIESLRLEYTQIEKLVPAF